MKKAIDKKQLIEYSSTMKNIVCAIMSNKPNGMRFIISQFRELSIACKACDTFEEADMLIRYKIATDNDCISWNFETEWGETIGEAVLDKISLIRRNYDDDTVLYALSYFFGYLFRSAVIWESGIDDTEHDKNDDDGECEDVAF